MQPPPLQFPANGSQLSTRPPKGPAVVLTAIITTVVVSLFWIAAIGGLAYYFTRNTPSFSVKVDAPSHAEVGETITVNMKVSNPHKQVLTLDSIDLEDSLLEGFKVTGVSPAAAALPGLGNSSYHFSKTLSSGETMEVIFELEALKPGVWSGDIDFCTPSLDFITSSTTIRVDAAGTAPEMAESEFEETPPFVLDIKTPHIVTLGENFTLQASVTNPTDSPLVLECIDLGGTLPEGLELQGITPRPETNGSDDETWWLRYSKSLLPGETLSTEFVIKPIKEGIWTGDLDFWDEDEEKFVSSSVTIRVNPSPAGKTPDPD